VDYITLEELKHNLSMEGEDFADDTLTLAIAAASRMVEHAASGRTFGKSAAGTVRFFTAASYGSVRLGDVVALTEVATDPAGDNTFSEVWTPADYRLTPLNAAADGDPYKRLESTGAKVFPLCHGAVRLTGTFGWPRVPDEIKQATSILAARLAARAREAPMGVAGFGADGAAVRIARTDPDVASLLAPFTELAFP
jgi:hypothetical protein